MNTYKNNSVVILLCTLFFIFNSEILKAGNFTWNGATSTSWTTSTNWTPNGVPGTNDTITIVTGSNNVYLSSSLTIKQITVTSGTLDLQSYSLTVSGIGNFNSGNVNNGTLMIYGTSTQTFKGTQFGAIVKVTGNSILLNGSTFNDSLIVVKKGSSNDNGKGNNTFNGYVSLTDSATGNLVLSDSFPDIFNGSLDVNKRSTGSIYLAHRGTGNQFNGDVTFNGGNGQSNYYGSATYSGNIILNGNVYFGYGGGSCVLSTGKSISVGTSGISAGWLYFKNFTQQDSTSKISLALTGTSQLYFESGSTFNDSVTASAPQLFLNGSRFNGVAHLTNYGSSSTTSTGGCYFKKKASIFNSCATPITYSFSTTSIDTFVTDAFIQNNIGTLAFSKAVFLGAVTLKNANTTTGSDRYFISSAGQTVFKGAVTIDNATSGMVFGNTSGTIILDSTASLSFTTGFTGNIALKGITQLGTTAQNFTFPSASSKLILGPRNTFGGPFTYYGHYIQLNGSIFNSTVNVTRYGSGSDICIGGNVFNGTTVLKDSSSHGNSFVLANANGDDFNGDVTFVQKGTGVVIYPAYNSSSTFSGNVSIDGSSVIPFGQNGGKVIFDGGNSTTISKIGSYVPTIKKIEVNKSAGTIALGFPLTIKDSLLLIKGVLSTDTTNILTIDTATYVGGASDSSYISGPAIKKGGADFTFPLGDNGKYRPITISSLSSSTNFTAKYFSNDPDVNFDINNKDSIIDNISRCEFWKLSSSTSATAKVSLKLSSDVCSVDTLSHQRIARWNGTDWKNDGYAGLFSSTGTNNVFTISGVNSSAIPNSDFTSTGYERGMYVDQFVKVRGAALDTAFSILGVTDIVSGHPTYNSYYKENQLLDYASKNHIVYLTLYDLRNVLGQNLSCKDSITGGTMSMENRLCDFINKAKNKYCIQKIGIIGSSKSFFCDGLASGSSQVDCDNASSTPAILRTSLPDPENILSGLDIIENSFSPGDPSFVRSEMAKFLVRIGLSVIACSSSIDIINIEHEYWNGEVTYNNYIKELTDMDKIKNWYNSLNNNKIATEVYLGFLNKNTLNTTLDVAGDMDGTQSGIKPRLADRILEHHYTKSPYNPAVGTCVPKSCTFYYGYESSGCKLRSDYFKDPSTIHETNHRPIFSAESTAFQWTADFFGAWFPASIRNNIFEAERIYYNAYDYDKDLSNLGSSENIMPPGTAQWFTYSLMGKPLQNPVLFRDTILPGISGVSNSTYSPYCITTATVNTAFLYQGPIEQGLKYEFSLKDHLGNKIFPVSGVENGFTSDYSTIPSPDGNSSNVRLPQYILTAKPEPYEAEILMTYDPLVSTPKCSYSYKKKIFISNTPLIEIMDASNPLGPITVCENQDIVLLASAGASYQWKLNGQNISGATNQEYKPHESGEYTCCINCGSAGACDGLSNVISVTFTSIENHLIRIGCSSSSSVTLTVYPQISGETYTWLGSSSTAANISVSSSGNYEVLITKGNCQTKAKVFVQSQAFNTSGPANPTISPNTATICEGGSVTVTVSSPNKTEGGAYFWSNGQTYWYNTSASSYPDPTATMVADGNYFVIYQSPNGCSSDPTASSSLLTISTSDGATVDAGADIVACSGSAINLNGVITNGSSPLWSIQSGGSGSFGNTTQPITTFTPSSSGRYKLRLTASSSSPCANTFDEIYIDVVSSGTPAVSIVTSKSIVCQGESIEFTAVTSGLGTSPTYSWQINGDPAGNSSRSFVSSVNNGDVVSVLVTGASPSCINGIQISESTTITVYSNNTLPGISASPGVSVCKGTNVTLTSTSTASSYLWSYGGISTQSLIISNSGDYYLKLVDANGCISPETMIHIDAIDLPLPQVQITSTPSKMKFCASQVLTPVTLNCYFPNGVGYTYVWKNLSTNAFYSGQTHTINASSNEFGTYIAEISQGGCTKETEPLYYGVVSNPIAAAYATLSGTNCLTSNVNIGVTPIGGELPFTFAWSPGNYPTQTVNNIARNNYSVTITDVNGCTASASIPNTGLAVSIIPSITTVICPGSAIKLTSSISASSYSWSTSPVQTTKSITINPTTTSTYTLTVTDANGCTATSSYLVNVSAGSSLSTSISSSTNSICQGNSVTLTCNTSSGVSYAWNTGIPGQVISVQPHIIPTTTYSVVVTDANGCTASATKAITVNAVPVAIISSTSNVICSGASTSLDAGSGFSSYLWNTTQNTRTINVNSAGSYSCTVSNSNGCTASATTAVLVNTLPTVSVTSSSSICIGESKTLIASGATDYQWAPISCTSCTSITVSPNVTTVYTVTGTDANGCSASATSTVTYDESCCGSPSAQIINNNNDPLYTISAVSRSLSYNAIVNSSITLTNLNLEIAQGVKITVQSSGHLIIDGGNFHPCGNQWYGIIVEDGGVLEIKGGATIEGALFGIEARDGSEINLDDVDFLRNYVGLYIPPNASNSVSLTIHETNFSCATPLYDEYDGQSVLQGTYSYAGILINDVSGVVIGVNGSTKNHFESLNIGIASNNSNLTVINSDFKDIAPDLFYGNDFDGAGIYATGISGNYSLNERGLGNYPTISDPYTFENCKYGIYSEFMNLDARYNSMNNCDIGAVVQNGNSKKLTVSGNNIDCNQFGIYSWMNDGADQLYLGGNDITIGTRSGFVNPIGISVLDNGTTNSSMTLETNTIFLNSNAKTGISLTRAFDYNVRLNYVELMDETTNEAGVKSFSSERSVISCNNVTAPEFSISTNSGMYGFYNSMNTGQIVKCNNVHNTYNGFYFSGISLQTKFKGNEMNEHYYGLYLDGSANIDLQYNSTSLAFGNLWKSTLYTGSSGIGTYAAYNANTQGFLSRINYDPTVNFAEPINIFDNSSSGVWMQATTMDQTFTCDAAPFDDACYLVDSDTLKDIKDVDYLIAADSIHSDNYEEEVKWNSKKYLFSKLDNNKSLLDSSLAIEQFYDSVKQTNLYPIKMIEDYTEVLFENQSLAKSGIKFNDSLITANLHLISHNDSLILYGSLNSTQISILKNINIVLRDSVKSATNSNRIIYSGLYVNKESKIDSALAYGGGITVGKVYEENEKDITSIYFNTVAKNRNDLIENYSNELYEIAHQCPLAGGPAVYRARSLYSYLNKDEYYNDIELCASSSRKSGEIVANIALISNTAVIYPNPTTEKSELTFNGESYKTHLDIENILGQIQSSESINGYSGSINLDCSSMKSGIYFCKIYGIDNKMLNCIKMIIEK